MSTIHYASRMDALSEASSIRRNNQVYEMRERGIDVITLSLGEAYFDIPTPSFDGFSSRDLHHYSHSRGVPLLREKLCKYYADEFGLNSHPDRELLITAGSKAAIYMALAALLEPGDEVIIPEPMWVSYPEQVRLCGGVPVMVPWQESVEELAGHITVRTRAIIVNDPHNPTGRRLTEPEMRLLHALAERHDLFLIADEAYSEFVPADAKFTSLGALDPDKRHTIVCNSMSKNYGISGWRIGYLIAHEKLVEQIIKLQQHILTCAPTILCSYLAENFDHVLQITRPQIEEIVSRRNRIERELARSGIVCLPGDSTFYLFASLGDCTDSEFFAEKLLIDKQVSVVPGPGYGDSCTQFVRISIGTESEDRVMQGISALVDLVGELN
ncbi:pyridoxal phosphate-dependent aminotransferase [Streptomyces sp. NPDC001118]